MHSSYAPFTSAKRAELKAQAHALNPVVTIGPDGLSDAVIHEIDRNLKAHQLIKIRIFEDVRVQREAVYQALCDRLKAHPVQHIGKLFIVWRPDTPDEFQNTSTHSTHRNAGAPPRKITIVKPRPSSLRRPTRKTVRILGNQRVTQGGTVKRTRPRLSSVKKKF